MNEEHEKYRPRSPDLSGFAPPPNLNRITSYHQPDPSFPPGYSFSPRGSYDASPYFSPQTTQPSASYFPSQSVVPSHSYRTPSFTANQSQFQTFPQNFSTASYIAPPQPRHPQQSSFDNLNYQDHSSKQSTQIEGASQAALESKMARTRQRKNIDQFDANYDPKNNAPSRTMLQSDQKMPSSVAAPVNRPTDPAHGIDVKTKFPVARIKRIMQADEDVGKVAQATPTAVSKALELFMITLVLKGAEEAKSQSSRRVTVQHLKAALMKDGQYDFLTDICENVPDEGSKKGRGKSDAKSEESDEGDSGSKKKSKSSKKRKAGTDDDSD